MNKQEALDKIEELKKFVETFPSDRVKEYIDTLNNSSGVREGLCENKILIETVAKLNRNIKIPLPNTNDNWTFYAFDLAKLIVRHLKGELGLYAYPKHSREQLYNYIYIRVQGE